MHIKDILSNWIVKNLLLAVLFVLGLALVTNIVLGLITQHGKHVTVPDFTNMSVAEAKYNAEKVGMKVEVWDSVYVRRMKKGAVFSQNPKAGSQVKKGRRVLVTTNAVTPKKVAMPFLVGLSMRQARTELLSKGLVPGRLIYVSDMATNNVLRQLYRNREISDGTKIVSGSTIDLVVGLSEEESLTYAPDVTGMKYLRSVDAVQENSLNIGELQFDSSVKTYNDSLNAVVYDQKPVPDGLPVPIGSEISLYLTVDELRLKSK